MTVKQRQTPDPASPIARLRKVANDLTEEGFEEGLAKLGRKPDRNKPTIGGEARKKTAKRPRTTDTEQSLEFERVANEHGARTSSEVEFNEMLKKLSKPKS